MNRASSITMPLQIALSSDSSSTLITHAYPMLLASVTMSLLLFYIRYTRSAIQGGSRILSQIPIPALDGGRKKEKTYVQM